MKKISSFISLYLIGLSSFIRWTVSYSSSASTPKISKNNRSEIILEIPSVNNTQSLNLTDIQKKIESPDLTFSEYQQISKKLAQAKASFEKVLYQKCGVKIPRIEDRDRLMRPISTPMVQDKTAVPGHHARQKERLYTQSDWEHEYFCMDLMQLYEDLFSTQSFYQLHVDLGKFIEKKGIRSCQNDDYLNYVNHVRHYEILNQCENNERSTQPICLTQFHQPEALDPIRFSKEVSQSLSELIRQSLPVYEEVIKNAENDLAKLQAEIAEHAERMRKAGIGTAVPGQDNLRPPRVEELTREEYRRRSKPYSDIIKTRKEWIQIGKEFLAELQKPIQTIEDANKRMESLIRYAPRLVDQAFSELEAWSGCNPALAKKIRQLKITLCENFNRAKDKKDRDQKIIDVLNSLSQIAYIGSAGTALSGNLPLSTGLVATGAVAGVSSKALEYYTTDDLARYRAISTAVFGNHDAAEAYLSLRENSAKNTLTDIALELATTVGPISALRISKIARSGTRVHLSLAATRIPRPTSFTIPGVSRQVLGRSQHFKVLASTPDEIIEKQIQFLIDSSPGLKNLENLDQVRLQLKRGIEYAYKRNQRVVFGGSRVRGDHLPGSDLDIGFGPVASNGITTNNDVAKILSKFREGPLPIEQTKIYQGGGTKNIPTIISPEEFFQRSGVRAATDVKAGQVYKGSGSYTLLPDGTIIFLPPP